MSTYLGSVDIIGGHNYAITKRHYDADDFTQIDFGALNAIGVFADYYLVGLNAAAAEPNIIDVNAGWVLYTHGQPAFPAMTQLTALVLGITLPALTPQLPAFEAKEIQFYADADFFVQYGTTSNYTEHRNSIVPTPTTTPHIIPANTLVTVRRRTFMLFISPVTPGDGTINISMFG